jgi:hypothetical protein
MTEVTQADREAFARMEGHEPDDMGWRIITEPTNGDCVGVQAFARHRQYGHDQGYYDGRQYDGAEERAKIVAYLRKTFGFDSEAADAIEAKEHLK